MSDENENVTRTKIIASQLPKPEPALSEDFEAADFVETSGK